MFLEDERAHELASESILRKERENSVKRWSHFCCDVFKAERCEHMPKLKRSFSKKNQDEGRNVIE